MVVGSGSGAGISGLNRGTLISGAGHLVLILGLFLGDWFDAWMEFDTTPLEVADVMIVSEREYTGHVLPQPQAPELPDIPDALVVPSSDVPSATPKPADEPAVVEKPDSMDSGEVEPSPERLELPEISGAAPPDPGEDLTIDVTVPAPVPLVSQDALPSDKAPTPQEAPRIAPTPVPESPPTPEFSEIPVPSVSPDSSSLDVELDLPRATPEEATTEIVTEAETPSFAPTTSIIPILRSERPVDVEPTQGAEPDPATPPPSPAEPERDQETEQTSTDVSRAIEQALEAALSGAASDVEPTPVPTPALSPGEIDALRVAVGSCWNLGATGSEALRVVVTVGVSMTRDGRPGNPRLVRFSGGSEAAARIAFDAARRAILRCGLEGYDLPEDRYEQWREIEITFNPEEMRLK